MKSKNGFVFVETMIVVVVLITILLIIYSSYTSLITLERRQARYDDPLFIYRTHAIAEFLASLQDNNGNSIIGNQINELDLINSDGISDNDISFIVISPTNQELFNENDNRNDLRQNFFSSMYNNFNIKILILINSSGLKKMEERKINEKLPSDFYKYLKTIDTSEDKTYLVAMYAETVNGNWCEPNDLYNEHNSSPASSNSNGENSCTFYYSNLELEREVLT